MITTTIEEGTLEITSEVYSIVPNTEASNISFMDDVCTVEVTNEPTIVSVDPLDTTIELNQSIFTIVTDPLEVTLSLEETKIELVELGIQGPAGQNGGVDSQDTITIPSGNTEIVSLNNLTTSLGVKWLVSIESPNDGLTKYFEVMSTKNCFVVSGIIGDGIKIATEIVESGGFTELHLTNNHSEGIIATALRFSINRL